ncbi:MAG TPA: hypothetical protein VD931_06295 [Baekduia sp.]|nr:hypothetical protein [Baekduia sp.]
MRAWRDRGTLGLALLASVIALWPSTTSARAPAANQCVTPAGDDLNQTFATDDAFIAPFCRTARVGDHWRPIVRIAMAGSDPVFPSGFTPSAPDLLEDFFAKFVSARYVVDAGTKRERSFTFTADQLIFETGALPDGSVFVRWMPRLRPLPKGEHTVTEYLTLRADFWDGLGTDPQLNLIPAGESLVDQLAFTVVTPSRSGR